LVKQVAGILSRPLSDAPILLDTDAKIDLSGLALLEKWEDVDFTVTHMHPPHTRWRRANGLNSLNPALRLAVSPRSPLGAALCAFMRLGVPGPDLLIG